MGSNYVYILTQYGTVYGACTAKHELAAMVARSIPKHLYSEYRVQRVPDGVLATGENTLHQTLPEFLGMVQTLS